MPKPTAIRSIIGLSLMAAALVQTGVATASGSGALRYQLDPRQSDVAAKVNFFGLASKTARFPKVSGGIELVPARLDTIRMDVTLDASALEAGDPLTLERLKGENFFDVARHPTVRFSGRRMTMTGPATAIVEGDLTARGVTRPVVLDVSFAEPPASASGREPIQFSAQTRIDRTDFGMAAYRLIVGKTVTITIKAQMVPG